MALILAIETSNPSSRCGVALASFDSREGMEGKPVVLTPLGVAWLGEDGAGGPLPGERGGLMPTIDRLFREAGLGPNALRERGTRIAVSVGPGGYTSVRVAVTAAKLLAEGVGAICISVPTAEVVARRVTHPRPFAVVLASKRETAWVTTFDPRPESTAPVRARPAPAGLVDARVVDALRADGVDHLVVDRFVPPEMRAGALAAGIQLAQPEFDPLACAELGVMLEPTDAIALVPHYPREPEAVTKWRARHGGPTNQ